jgi:hypothetical protein
VQWRSVDVGAADAVSELITVFAGADVVIHLAWQIQPSHDRARIRLSSAGSPAPARWTHWPS